ncbi:hypothetical protein [Burkholderia ubonensis]|uniref:hypothetical protein n=1 Tax=Burkholderia ubonensis TaxID=101571 RepID=UPI0008FE38EA|nr:hypothetical protein [Burkholderia ubonensis]
MQELLGHASLGTTARYTKADAARQYQVDEASFYAVLDGSDALATQAASVPIARSAAAPQIIAGLLGEIIESVGRNIASFFSRNNNPENLVVTFPKV